MSPTPSQTRNVKIKTTLKQANIYFTTRVNNDTKCKSNDVGASVSNGNVTHLFNYLFFIITKLYLNRYENQNEEYNSNDKKKDVRHEGTDAHKHAHIHAH